MPVYEYACEKCKHEFEAEQRISDDPIRTCPKCRARKVKRLISRTSFVLKGSGWYSDLYSSGGKKDDAKPESGDKASPTETQSDAKSESKSETKSEKTEKAEKSEKKPAKSDAKKSKSKAA